LSYFAEPNFIIYDEWFDDDLEKTKLDVKNKKLNFYYDRILSDAKLKYKIFKN